MLMIRLKEMFLKYPTRTITFSFFCVILIGSLLLSLPIANQTGSVEYLDHLFVAVSATCVTGLVPFTVANQYTLFGQIVIILMIQIGGLGFLTFLMLFFVIAKKRLSFSGRLLIQEALNKKNLDNVGRFILRIIRYTFFCEGLGAILLTIAFLPEFGLFKAIYYGLFHAVSAFCNAGFDVLGNSSLIAYQDSWLVLLTISFLIIAGGIGFVVALEIKDRFQSYLTSHDSFHKFCHSFSLQMKLVVGITFLLLLSGTCFVYFFEGDNPATLGEMPFGQKILNAFFQSVTYRTAGFASFDQAAMQEVSKLLACFYMFIGGSPAGTAGGIKTITLGILLLCVRSVVYGKKAVTAFGRSIRDELVRQAMAVICISISIVASAILLLCVLEPYPMIDLFFEAFSAFATVGLTANLTPYLSTLGKIVIMVLMFIGRIGPVTMVLVFLKRRQQNRDNEIGYPYEDLLVG